MKFIYRLLVISLLAVPVFRVAAQPNNPKVAIVAFYNVENLFDTENDPLKNDEDFLPEGSYQWTPERYAEKLRHLSDVISLIGKEFGGPVILGVSEIENVSTDLTDPFIGRFLDVLVELSLNHINPLYDISIHVVSKPGQDLIPRVKLNRGYLYKRHEDY